MSHRTQVMAGALLAALGWAASGIAGAQNAIALPPPPGLWRNAPEYVRLFGPAAVHTEAYRAYVSPLDLQILLQRLGSESSLLHPPGSWVPSALLPQDAFGKTGSYNPWKVARLFGARRAMVARGPRGEDGRPYEAWTLISPYPDKNLERLETGTLLIVLDLAK